MSTPTLLASTSTSRRTARRGSVLIVVLVTLVFATAALVIFIEKATTDLLVVQRDATADRLRFEAYSALETTLGVLVDFRDAIGGLHSPEEGWGDPLGFAGYEPGPDRTVTVTFEDESGKISLPSVDAPTWVNVFTAWQLTQTDADKLADALLGWMQVDYTPGVAGAPRPEDYDRGDLPFQPPARSLRSYSELAAINVAKEIFYDEKGRPNELWHRFAATFSLYRYQRPNLNAAAPDLLAAFGPVDPVQQRRLTEYLTGTGAQESVGKGFFKNTSEVASILGASSEAASAVGTTISALRVIVTVTEGGSSYRLAALVAPATGGARAPVSGDLNKETATTANPAANTGNSGSAAASSARAPTSANSSTAQTLNYPFTLLEIRENDAIPSPVAERPATDRP